MEGGGEGGVWWVVDGVGLTSVVGWGTTADGGDFDIRLR